MSSTMLVLSALLFLAHRSHVFAEKPSNSRGSARIIGGEYAPTNRYPYAVSIHSQGQHDCGGSLIAPDLILSAAHCIDPLAKIFINRDDLTAEAGESFNIVEEFIHPKYNFVDYPFDFMIIQIDGNSTIPPVRLNRDQFVPQESETLTVMGWGRTVTDGEYVPSDKLKTADVTSHSQEKCRNYWRGTQAVTDDMLCITGKTGFDCRGDSGSPLIVPSADDPTTDVQVGLAAWGPVECDDPVAPSIYSRVSDQIDWIDSIVCHHSSNPPNDFDCANAPPIIQESPPQPESTIVLPGQVSVTITLDLDSRPYETGFNLEDEKGNILHRFNPGNYKRQERAVETVILDANKSYSIVLVDFGNDGFCCDHGAGSYEIRLGGDRQGGHLLLSGTGDFGTWERKRFFTSTKGTMYESADLSGNFPIVVRVQTQFSPQDIAWSLHQVDIPGRPVLASVEAGRYAGKRSAEQEVVMGVKGGLYAFTFTDPHNFHGFDIFVGGTAVRDATRVASGAGETTITFEAQLPDHSKIAHSTKESSSLILEINFDDNPSQVGWYLMAQPEDTLAIGRSSEPNKELIAFGPQESYYEGLANRQTFESIIIPAFSANLEYTLVMFDAGEDGLCCQHGRGSFSLYRGDHEIVSNNFEDQERITYSFNGFDVDDDAPRSTTSTFYLSSVVTSTICALVIFMSY